MDVVIQDMNFTADTTSGEEGRALFRAIRERDPDLPVILFTAWTDLETAVELVKAGAADDLARPWDDERLVTTARNLLALRENTLERRRLAEARRASPRRLADRYELCGIVYESDAMQELLLDTVIQATPLALVLLGPGGAVIYSNTSARQLFLGGRKLEGLDFGNVLEAAPEALRHAVHSGQDGLFTIEGERTSSRVMPGSPASRGPSPRPWTGKASWPASPAWSATGSKAPCRRGPDGSIPLSSSRC